MNISSHDLETLLDAARDATMWASISMDAAENAHRRSHTIVVILTAMIAAREATSDATEEDAP